MLLITGVNGLLGSALVEALSASPRPEALASLTPEALRASPRGEAFTGLDHTPCQNAYLSPGYPFVQQDLTDAAATRALLDRLSPTTVLHGAALTAVDLCETERALAWRINVEATATIAAWCQAHDRRMIYVSTDYVFDGTVGAYRESSGLRPLGVYAVTKAAGELATQALAKNHVIARTAVPFGHYPHVKKDFVRWLREELSAKRPVRIVTDQISNPTYAVDLARMLLAIVARPEITGVVHTAGATSVSRLEFAKLVARIFGFDATLITPIRTIDLKQAAPRPLDASLEVKRAEQLGLEPRALEAALVALQAKETGASHG